MKQPTQAEIILDLLKVHSCCPSDFMRKGIAQYNARIHELRKEGHNIQKTHDKFVKVGSKLVRETLYTLMI